MRRFFQKLKAAAVIGIAWAIPWALGGVGLAIYEGGGWLFSLTELMTMLGVIFGTVGFAGGTAFALALTAAERNRTIDDLSRVRVGLLGALGGALSLPIVAGVVMLLGEPVGFALADMAVMAAFGAGSSLATLGVARAAPSLPSDRSDPTLLESGDG